MGLHNTAGLQLLTFNSAHIWKQQLVFYSNTLFVVQLYFANIFSEQEVRF